MSSFINNLRREVFDSRINRFRLDNDLRSLEMVRSSGANEAVVFYSARILEAVIKEAHLLFFGEVGRKGGEESTLSDREKELFDYNLLMQNRYYWAKGLRLLGNEVRHSLRRITTEEADCALIFLEFILTWYFTEFPMGPRQTTIYKGASVQWGTSTNRLLDLAWAMQRSSWKPETVKVVFGPHQEAFFKGFDKNPVFALLLMEILIAQGDHAAATQLVEELNRSGFQPERSLRSRYRQLRGLLLSREEKLHEALEMLEPGYLAQRRKVRPAWVDEETVGIVAGVYKRLWRHEDDSGFLDKSHQAYLWGWLQNRNPYLGINAATTALWQQKMRESEAIAGEVIKVLEQRRGVIQEKTQSRYDLSYWDLVTLAEANILVKDLASADALYTLAFERYAKQHQNIEVTRTQLARIARCMALSEDEMRMLPC